MKNIKLILAAVAFVGGIGSAFATKPLTQRDLWQKSGSQCALISCSQANHNVGDCTITGTKYTESTCTTVYTGQAFKVALP